MGDILLVESPYTFELYIPKRLSSIRCSVGVGKEFGNACIYVYTHVLYKLVPNYKKGGLSACPQIIIENNTEMHHRKKIGGVF